jgi:hypothetical protein
VAGEGTRRWGAVHLPGGVFRPLERPNLLAQRYGAATRGSSGASLIPRKFRAFPDARYVCRLTDAVEPFSAQAARFDVWPQNSPVPVFGRGQCIREEQSRSGRYARWQMYVVFVVRSLAAWPGLRHR